MPRPHQGIITGDGYRLSEPIRGGRIVGHDLGLLAPGGAVADKDIGGAGAGAPVIVLGRPHHGIITGDGYKISEIIIGGRIVGHELGIFLSPKFKNIGGAGRAAPVIVINRPHQGILTGDGYRISEIIRLVRIALSEPGLLGPGGAIADKGIGAAGLSDGLSIVSVRPHQGIITGDGYRISEQITKGRNIGHELGLLGPGGAVADKGIGGAG